MSILQTALWEATMSRVREIVAALLTFALVATSAWGKPTDALGTIVTATDASIGGAGAAVGTTVFSGDRMSTMASGSLQLRTQSARFLLDKSSTATLNEDGGMPSATLLQGTATFSTANAKAFALNVATAVIRAKGDEPTVGQATLLGAKELLVTCAKGALTISVGDDSRVIPAGSSYRVVLEPAASEAQNQPPPQGAGTKGMGRPPLVAGKSRFVWYAVGATAILTIIAVSEALESPDRP